MDAWFSFLSKWALVPLATIALFEGVRRVSWSRAGVTPALFLLFGLMQLGGHAAGLAWAASHLESSLAPVVEERVPPPLPEGALAQMTATEREEKTRLLAQIAFQNAGVVTTYVTAKGEQVRYAPTETEIRDRLSFRESVTRTLIQLEHLRLHAWIHALALVAAIATGACARWRGAPVAES